MASSSTNSFVRNDSGDDRILLVRKGLSLSYPGRIPRSTPASAIRILLEVIPDLLQETGVGQSELVLDLLSKWVEKYEGYASTMQAEFHPSPGLFSIHALTGEFQRLRGFALARNLPGLEEKMAVWESRLPPTSHPTPSEASDLVTLIHDMLVAIGATDGNGGALEPTSFIRTTDRKTKSSGTKKTQRAVLEFANADTGEHSKLSIDRVRESLGLPRRAFPVLQRLVAWVAKLCGRFNLWFEAWISAKCLVMGKVGLIYQHLFEDGVLEDLATKPCTLAFVAMACAEFGARKAFTIESQKQGALNEYLRLLLGLVKLYEPEGLVHIAWILPVQEVLGALEPETVVRIHQAQIEWMPIIGYALSKFWKAGVNRCFRRKGVVLPRGFRYQLNTTCWNHCADAWTNITRFARGCAHRLESTDPNLKSPFAIKVLQLVAGDQAHWALSASKGIHPDTSIFSKITCDLGILPWDIALHPEQWKIEAVLELIEASGRKLSWIGVPQLRDENLRIHTDMVCGVAVPPQLVQACIEIGAFGAHAWDSGKDDDK